MNRFYYGKIGGGKTYLVMLQEILPALRAGRKVVTNIDGLDVRLLRNFVGREVDIRVIKSHTWWRTKVWCQHIDNGTEDGGYVLSPDLVPGALYVIDECHDIWNARDFKNTSKDFITLLSYNRHFHIDLVFISQNVKLAEVNITRTANESYQVKNLGFLFGALAKKYIVNRRQTPMDKDVISTTKGTYDKNIFSLYQSGADGSKAVSGKSAFGSVYWYAVIVFSICSFVAVAVQGNPLKKLSMKGVKHETVSDRGLVFGGSVSAGEMDSKKVSELAGTGEAKNEGLNRLFVKDAFVMNKALCEHKGSAVWGEGQEAKFEVCEGRFYRVEKGVVTETYKLSDVSKEKGVFSSSSGSVPAGMTVDDLKGPKPDLVSLDNSEKKGIQ